MIRCECRGLDPLCNLCGGIGKLPYLNEEAVTSIAAVRGQVIFDHLFNKLDVATFSAVLQIFRDYDKGEYIPRT